MWGRDLEYPPHSISLDVPLHLQDYQVYLNALRVMLSEHLENPEVAPLA